MISQLRRVPAILRAIICDVFEAPHSICRQRGSKLILSARVLGHYVRELKLITLEDAVRKMTSLPAQTFNLRDRGLLREGFSADIVIFDDAVVGDRATFERPPRYAAGISYVLVNGVEVLAGGEMTKARPGMALRGPGAARVL